MPRENRREKIINILNYSKLTIAPFKKQDRSVISKDIINCLNIFTRTRNKKLSASELSEDINTIG